MNIAHAKADQNDGDRLDAILAMLHSLQTELGAVHQLLSGTLKPQYTVAELADLTGRSTYTIRRWITDGMLRAVRIQGTGPKGRLLVPRSELTRLFAGAKGDQIPVAAIADGERRGDPDDRCAYAGRQMSFESMVPAPTNPGERIAAGHDEGQKANIK